MAVLLHVSSTAEIQHMTLTLTSACRENISQMLHANHVIIRGNLSTALFIIFIIIINCSLRPSAIHLPASHHFGNTLSVNLLATLRKL